MRLYHSDWGLLDFQIEGVAYCLERLNNLAVWDTGIGKSHLAMATSAMLFEDGLIDLVIIICEKNKLDPTEWPGDLLKFTQFSYGVYHGPRRKRFLEDPPQVLLSTYETIRNDAAQLVKVPNRKTKKWVPNFFTNQMAGKRILVVYDEITKLGNRKSGLHKAHTVMIREFRKQGQCRVMGLTATPIERGPDNFYNIARLVMPDGAGTVASFERDYIKGKDLYNNPVSFKNLDPDSTEPGVTPFTEKIKPILLRKRKTDPDVVDQFPEIVEEFDWVDLDKRQGEFYDAVRGTLKGIDDGVLFGISRQIAAHPKALLHSEGQMAKRIVEHLGEDVISSIPSAKEKRLVEYLQPLVKGQGAQCVVFTFFGPSVIPYLHEALSEVGITSAMHYGSGMTDKDRQEARRQFKAGEVEVLLSSDAGARGINLPEASYAIEYESALTHAMRTQRLNRIHRIDSKHLLVTFMTFVSRETVEEDIAVTMLKRNEWSDQILDGDDPPQPFVSAVMRRKVLQLAKSG